MNIEEFLHFTSSVPLSSERPYDHVALAIALQEKGISSSAHMFKVTLKDSQGHTDVTPGMAVEISGSIVTIDGNVSWSQVEENETSFCNVLFEEVTGNKALSSSFHHQEIAQSKLDQAKDDPIIMETVALILPKLTDDIVKSLSKGVFEPEENTLHVPKQVVS